MAPGGAGVGDGDEAVGAREAAAERFAALVHLALAALALHFPGVLDGLEVVGAADGVAELLLLVLLLAAHVLVALAVLALDLAGVVDQVVAVRTVEGVAERLLIVLPEELPPKATRNPCDVAENSIGKPNVR